MMQRTAMFCALGTVNTVFLPQLEHEQAADLVRERVVKLSNRLSVFRQESEISRLNQNAGIRPVAVGTDTMFLLRRATEWAQKSDGAFDITAAPLTSLWRTAKQSRTLPDEKKRNAARELVNFRDLILNEAAGTAFLRRRGQAVDLGGIAKGYAADEAERILRECGITSALLNLGGNLIALGSQPGGEPWRLGVQKPFASNGECVAALHLADRTMVTSGIYENCFYHNGVCYHHLIDPRTGMPAENGLTAVTVVAKASVDADALSTAAFVLGAKQGAQLLQEHHAEGIFLCRDHKIFTTPGLRSAVRLTANLPDASLPQINSILLSNLQRTAANRFATT